MKTTLRQMEIFLEVAKVGHLTEVAKKMNLSQSAISMSLKELESTLGCKLFDRIQKKLVLNEKGRSYRHSIETLVQKLKDIEEEFMSKENRGELRIGASTTIADYIMPKIICEYMDKYPDVKITMKIGNSEEIVKMVEEGSVDLGYIEGEEEELDVVAIPIGVDELVIVTADKSLTKKKEYFIDNLIDYRWILREEGSGTRSIFLNRIKKYITNLNLFLELKHIESIKSALKSTTQSLSCISKIAVKDEIKNGELFEIKVKGFDFSREFYQIHHKDKYKSELFKKFTTFVRYKIGELLKDRDEKSL